MSERSTAELLGSFYKELVGSGVPDELAGEITRTAAAQHLRDYGVTVKETING